MFTHIIYYLKIKAFDESFFRFFLEFYLFVCFSSLESRFRKEDVAYRLLSLGRQFVIREHGLYKSNLT